MTKNIYYHRKVQVAEHYLGEFLKSLAEDCNSFDRDELDIPANFHSFLKQSFAFTTSDQSVDAFTESTFTLYSSLTDFDVWAASRSVKDRQEIKNTSELASRLFNRNLPKCYAVRPEGYEGAAHLVNDFTKNLGASCWKAGIKPRPVKTYKSAKDPILVRDESGSTYSIEASSKFFTAFADSDEKSPFLWIDREIEGSNEAKKLLSDLRKKGYIDNLADTDSDTNKAA